MVIVVLHSSKVVTERLIELISEARQGILFHKAFSYTEATDLLNKHKADAVILDWMLTGNKSGAIIKRAKNVNKNAVIIILSGYIDKYLQEQCKKFSADFLLDKYNDFEKLPAIIKGVNISI